MKCAQVRELLSAYVDGVLSPAETELLEDHLTGCKACREELLHLKETIHLLQSLSEIPLPQDFASRLHVRLEDAAMPVKKSFARRLMKSPWISFAAAAALVFIIWTAANPILFKAPLSDLVGQESAGKQTSIAQQAADSVDPALSPAAAKDSSAVTDGAAAKEAAKDTAKDTAASDKAAEEETLTQKSAAKEVVIEKNGDISGAARQNSRESIKETAPSDGGSSLQTEALVPFAKAVPESPADGTMSITGTANMVRSKALMMDAAKPLVLQSASLTLSVDGRSFSQILDEVSAQYPVESIDPDHGVIIFQVPKEEWDQALQLLKGAGTLSSVDRTETDFRDDYSGTVNKLTEFRERLDDVLNALALSGNVDERVQLAVEKHDLEGEIALMEERLSYLEQKAAIVETRLSLSGFSDKGTIDESSSDEGSTPEPEE